MADLGDRLAGAEVRLDALEARIDGGGAVSAKIRGFSFFFFYASSLRFFIFFLAPPLTLSTPHHLPGPPPPPPPQATTIAKLQYQVLHLTRSLKAADAALDAALAPTGADLDALRAARWAAPLNQTR